MKPFIWLSSYPKSGNTWIRIFLGAYINGGSVNFNDLPRQASNSDLMAYYYNSLAPCPLNHLTTAGSISLRPAVLQHIARFGGRHPIPLKTHNANFSVYGIPLIPPFATEGAVYLIRDPRDVAVSFSRHTGETIDETIQRMGEITDALGSAKEHEKPLFHMTSSWSNHVDSWLSNPEFPVEAFTYEKLVAEPEDSFKRILEFLGYEINAEVFEKALENTSFGRLKQKEEKDGFEEAANGTFFNTGTPGNWKKVLTESQVKKIEEDHGPVMEKLGYV